VVGNVYDHLNGLERTQRVQKKKRQDRWPHGGELKMVCDFPPWWWWEDDDMRTTTMLYLVGLIFPP